MISTPPSHRRRRRFVVVGLGHVGRRVVALLRRIDAEVVVITAPTRSDWLDDATRRGAGVMVGDGRDRRLLAAARLGDADALFALTDGDLVNLEIALDARRLREDLPIVARISDQTLGRHLERSLGLRRAVGVSTVAAPVFTAAALGERVAGAFELEGVPLVLRLPESGGDPVLAPREAFVKRLADRSAAPVRGRVAEALDLIRRAARNAPRGLKAIGLVLLVLVAGSVAVFRVGLGLSLIDAVYFVITTVTTTGYGDISAKDAGVAIKIYACLLMLLGSASTAVLYSFVTDFLVTERVESLIGRRRGAARDHVIVAGMGDVGRRATDDLARSGVPFVVVDPRADTDRLEAVRAGGSFLVGDARTAAVLEEAGAREARAVLAVTGDEAVNLGIALEAKAINPNLRAVVRIFDPELAAKVERGMSVDAVVSASAVVAPVFVGAALYPDAFAATALDDALLVLRDVLVPASGEGRLVTDLALEAGGTAILHAPPGGAFTEVTPDLCARAGGRVVVSVRVRFEPEAAPLSVQAPAETIAS